MLKTLQFVRFCYTSAAAQCVVGRQIGTRVHSVCTYVHLTSILVENVACKWLGLGHLSGLPRLHFLSMYTEPVHFACDAVSGRFCYAQVGYQAASRA